MKKLIGSLTMAVALAVMVFSVSAVAQGSGSKMKDSMGMAPSFSALDHNGKQHSLEDYRGKVVVLEWLNPGCPFVQRHYREGTFKGLAEQYGERGVVWLAVNSTSGNDAEVSRKWAQQHDLPYPILVDKSSQVAKLYDAKTTPHMFVVGRSGELVYQGAVDDDPNGTKESRTHYARLAIEAALVGSAPDMRETKPYGCAVKYASN
ncbi:MAG: thioredoxin family protein [Candidatus Glassbacteria bacterium]|nr:thioredoxin family protein [Candidatus Glassbacteria bacterium]